MNGYLSDKTCLVRDYGNYPAIAERLAKDFRTVFYSTPSTTDGFPIHTPDQIGDGLNNVINIRNAEPFGTKVDLNYFCDLYEEDTQNYLRAEGHPVFGLGVAQRLETDRIYLKRVLEETGLSVNHYDVIQGIAALKDFLKDKTNKWIKTNYYRGEGETWKFKDMDISEWRMDRIQANLGINKDTELFLIEDPIPDAVEVGYDGFIMDGQFPNRTLFGVEAKDCYYFGRIIPYHQLPRIIKKTNKALAPYFKEAGSRGKFSTEVRYLKNGEGYLIDMTCREPQPPGDLQLEMYKDYSYICWEIANGRMPNVDYNHEFGVQVIIKCHEIEERKPQLIRFDEKYKQFVKIKNLSIKDGKYYYLPQNDMHEIGSVLGVGKTLSEAMKMATDICKTIEGDCIEANADVLSGVKTEIKKLVEYGIDIF